MKFRLLISAAALGSLITFATLSADDAAPGDDVKCHVSGQKVKAASFVEHNGGKVYFCCNNCPKEFKANTEKYAAKANHQLAQTKQLTQSACPITGAKTKAGTELDVSGVSVAFCCNNCKGKVQSADADKAIELCFGEANKGFKAKVAQ